MSDLLNNKWVVVLLAIGAGALLYFRLAVPIFDHYSESEFEADVYVDDGIDNDNSASAEAPESSSEQRLQLVSAQYDLNLIEIGSLRWNTSPTRDPFTTDNAAPVIATTGTNEGADAKLRLFPRVSAVVNSPSLKFAVVDGEILRVGDIIGNFRLRYIGVDRVSIERTSNNKLHVLMVEK